MFNSETRSQGAVLRYKNHSTGDLEAWSRRR